MSVLTFKELLGEAKKESPKGSWLQRMRAWVDSDDSAPEPVYDCPACKDMGDIEQTNGRWAACACRRRKQVKALFKSFGIDPAMAKGFSDFKPQTKEQAKALEKAIEFANCFQKCNSSTGLLLCGTPGTGKTHLAFAVAKHLIERRRPVKLDYFPYILAMNELKGLALDSDAQRRLRNRYLNSECLVIEDMYKEKSNTKSPISEADSKQFFAIICHRQFNRLPIIVTTELNRDEIIAVDKAIGRRIVEMCKGFTFTFEKDSIYRE